MTSSVITDCSPEQIIYCLQDYYIDSEREIENVLMVMTESNCDILSCHYVTCGSVIACR